MLTRKTIQGHFTRIDGSTQVGISETEARRLLVQHCRDVDEHIASLKGSPFAPVIGEGCKVMFEVHRAPVVTFPDGGPGLRAMEATPDEHAQFVMDQLADHDPVAYLRFANLYDQAEPAGRDSILAAAMEILDNCSADTTFTVRAAHDDTQILAFWPAEE